MNDTSFEMEKIFRSMLMKKTGQERLMMGFSMFNMARKQVIASIRMKTPDIRKSDMKKEIFLRFYGNDFSNEKKEEILRHL